MLLEELFSNVEPEDDSDPFLLQESAKMVWARRGNKVARKYRCTSGKKKGRIVSSPTACGKSVDLGKRMKFRKTLASKGFRMRRKAKMTKRRNPLSKRISRMNKALK